MNTLKHIFRSNVVMSILALGSLFVFKDAVAQTSDRAKEFTTNADGVTVDGDFESLNYEDVTGEEGYKVHNRAVSESENNQDVLYIIADVPKEKKYFASKAYHTLNGIFAGKYNVAIKLYFNETDNGVDGFTFIKKGRTVSEGSYRLSGFYPGGEFMKYMNEITSGLPVVKNNHAKAFTDLKQMYVEKNPESIPQLESN